MAFGSNARVAALEAQLAQMQQVFGRADARLDEYPAALANLFGDTLTEGHAGRWSAVGVVSDEYRVDVNNAPGAERTTFTALKHGRVITPLVIDLHPGSDEDFTAKDLEALEAWVMSAKTGVVPDPQRHNDRAAQMRALV